jgi:hypothetical protein
MNPWVIAAQILAVAMFIVIKAMHARESVALAKVEQVLVTVKCAYSPK